MQTPDPETAVVTYSEFNAGYLDQFPWIVPKHATGPAEEMATWEFNRDPIGTGPFKLQEWAPGEYLTTVKNENYREEGKPYLDGINFLVVPAEEARTARMIEGDGDVMLWAGDEAEEQIEAAGAGMGRIAPGIWVVEMWFNLSKPFDGDPGASRSAPDPGRPARARGDDAGGQPRADQPGAARGTRLRYRLAVRRRLDGLRGRAVRLRPRARQAAARRGRLAG